MDHVIQPADHFDVHHTGLDVSFRFSSSGELDTVSNIVRTQGLAAYEAPVTDIFIELIKADPGIVLDVGANTGLYTLTAVATDPSVQVIAFEPLGPVRRLLRRNIELNPDLASRITVKAVGLSDKIGSFSFYETINDRGYVSTSSSLEQQHVQAVGGDHVERIIHTATLDTFAEGLTDRAVSFMKIDVEGHEHAVISGGRQFLAKHRPIFTIELLEFSERASIDRLLDQGDYFAFAMAPDGLRQRERLMFFPDAWNYLMVPAEKLKHVLVLCRKLNLGLEFR